MTSEDVLMDHRVVGISGGSVLCACKYNPLTGAGKWHLPDWHVKHVAKKLAEASAVSTPPTITDDMVERAAEAISELHASSYVAQHDRDTARAALAAALHLGGETNE